MSGRALVLLVLIGACAREERRFTEIEPTSQPVQSAAHSTLTPVPSHVPGTPARRGPYDQSAWAISEGQHYFVWFNCAGCHSNGGGGMGPALMDHQWRYGSEPEDIYTSIVEGRPNGMPSFRGKIPEQQLWQLVAFVRSLSGLVRLDSEPGRSDSLSVKDPPFILKHGGVPAPTREHVGKVE